MKLGIGGHAFAEEATPALAHVRIDVMSGPDLEGDAFRANPAVRVPRRRRIFPSLPPPR